MPEIVRKRLFPWWKWGCLLQDIVKNWLMLIYEYLKLVQALCEKFVWKYCLGELRVSELRKLSQDLKGSIALHLCFDSNFYKYAEHVEHVEIKGSNAGNVDVAFHHAFENSIKIKPNQFLPWIAFF